MEAEERSAGVFPSRPI